jgi:quercetin dioxygenase-like cupin family protein
VPSRLAQLDALVLPSLTRPNWKEQFGRVLVEAMACGVPVVGSDSGEIPRVIGQAGLSFPEGDAGALRASLAELMGSERRRAELGARGRIRVLEFISDPGDKEGWHSHPAFVVYVVTGGTLRIRTPDGKSLDVEFKTGDIRYREPVTHTTENIGKSQLHAIIVELETP